MKNFEKYSEFIAEAIYDCKKNDDTVCICCKQREMCNQLYNVEQIKKWFFEEWKPKLTEDEKVILRNLHKKYKWIARDGNGDIFIFPDKPIKYESVWDYCGRESKSLILFSYLFEFIKWSDEEPYSIEELLEG